jgi:very-short-patch-repair endonuclease
MEPSSNYPEYGGVGTSKESSSPGEQVRGCENRVLEALRDARRELIDLSRRNRLLHTPQTGSRPHCLEIVDVDPDELFVAIARKGKQFSFRPFLNGENAHGQGDAGAVSGPSQLQTKLSREVLERRLIKFFREARTFEEEQGTNILFLAIGFLRWFEDDRSEEACVAPLLLVPVSLERRQGRQPFVLRGRDDDMVVNVSLAEKLRSTFGINLPDLPEGDEWLPSEYMDVVTNAAAGQSRWSVDSAGMGLGFFTFSKFLMWRDLDAGTWPKPGDLLNHELLAQLLGEDVPGDYEPPIVSDEESIDRVIDIASSIHVVDADSSQALCIEEARRGRNLVIQGPPGTGKSQTIANIIAATIREGKSVLFVAEKAAALEVVYGRLKMVGLEPLCLEIHSRKATKAAVVNALDRSIRTAGVTQNSNRNAAELRAARDRLNDWSATLHREIRASGRTPYQIMGTILKLRAEGVPVFGLRLDVAGDWDRDRLHMTAQAVARAANAIQKLGVTPSNHPWYGTGGDRLTPVDTERLKDALIVCGQRAGELIAIANKAAALLDTRLEFSSANLVRFAKCLRVLADLSEDGRRCLMSTAWRNERARINQLVEHGKLWSSTRSELSEILLDTAWTEEIAPTQTAIAAHGGSIFRFLCGSYRRAVAHLRGLCLAKPPRKRQERLLLLDKLAHAQSARHKLNEEKELGSAAFGAIWRAEDTPWQIAEFLLAWANKAEQTDHDIDLLGIAADVDTGLCASIGHDLETAFAAFQKASVKVTEFIRPDSKKIFNVDAIEQAAIPAISTRIDTWLASLTDFDDWAVARETLEVLRQHGLELIAEGLTNGSIQGHQAGPMTELLVAEALWASACSDNPDLKMIDGNERTQIVSDFRALDRKRIELARSEVLASYTERRPSGNAGEMGVIHGEIGKKRRHLPIRKLIEKAGGAVQRLKPVFLMSPLSVAQFIPPGRLTFDLVIIDEASQVPPEEALGLVGRGRQLVVVGDDKQLPPTNFFRMVAEDEEDDEEQSNDTIPTSRSRDYESILKLFRARGTTERMLRWHYRSKHPSLIALSNRVCYGGSLLLPPSPFNDQEDLGLRFVKTPSGHYDRGGSGRNTVEAGLIAEAVEKYLAENPTRSLGIACFSVAQRDAIEDALQQRGLLPEAEAFAPKDERLFIKNLESVQGDERDVIFISIGYGRDAEGRMTAGFGPLSQEGGERRLNVLISRARQQCVVFSSINAGDIPADAKARGTRMLRDFLHFAETGNIAAGEDNGGDFDSPFEQAVALAIQRNGHQLVSQVGVSGFRIDLGILDPDKPGRFVLGVECDGAAYHSSRSARDRDRLRQQVLEGLGWRLHRIWSTDWFRNPDRETQRLLAKIEQALASGENRLTSVVTNSFAGVTHLNIADLNQLPKASDADNDAVQPGRDAYEALSVAYREYRMRTFRGMELADLSQRELIDLVVSVVQHEGPIHSEEVARRIREAFGLGRTGHRILENVTRALESAARNGTIIREGDFWSAHATALEKPRNRRDAAPSLRRPDRIANQEYCLAIRTALRESVSASKDELIAVVARVFGFDRTGNGLDSAISEQIDRMIRAGEIRDEGGRLENANN